MPKTTWIIQDWTGRELTAFGTFTSFQAGLAEVKYLETLASGWPAKDRNRLTGLIAKARGK